MIPAVFDHIAPRSLDEALQLLATHGEEAKLMAGGQSLIPLLKLRLAAPKILVDLSRIAELRGIRQQDGEIFVGALATHFEIESSPLLKKKSPLLPETARSIGDVQVRNRGTVGGSLAHADPAADWPAAILALGGELSIRGPKGGRRLGADQFFLGPMTTALAADEMLTEIRLPTAAARSGTAYRKIAQRASGFAIVGVAVSLTLDGRGRCEDVRIGVTGLSDRPFRAERAETRLKGERPAAKALQASAAETAAGIEPLEDLHASAGFRAHLAALSCARALAEAAKRAGSRRG